MLICLIGHSSSGKSTVENELCKVGYNKIISYTTREPRKNEKNGSDYHFIDYPHFKRLEEEGFFQETAKYRDWLYGISLKDIDLKNEDYIAVVTVHGYQELLKHAKDDIVAIHIKVEDVKRVIRQIKRGDDILEIGRRIEADKVDFKDVEEICDYVVINEDLENTVEQILNIIQNTRG